MIFEFTPGLDEVFDYLFEIEASSPLSNNIEKDFILNIMSNIE